MTNLATPPKKHSADLDPIPVPASPRTPKPLLARVICALAALSDRSVDELATATGFPQPRVSQLRSGKRVNLSDAKALLDALGVDAVALIQQVQKTEAKHPGQLDELLNLLILALPPNTPEIDDKAGSVCCDRLVLMLPHSARDACDGLVKRVLERGEEVRKQHPHKHEVRYRGVTIGVGIKNEKLERIRLDFNPSKISSKGAALVRKFVECCPTVSAIHVTRVDVAVDLPVPIRYVQAVGTKARKLTTIGTAKGVETIYLGGKSGRRTIAIYDKREERGESGGQDPLTRFEVRFKKDRWRPHQLPDLPDIFSELMLLWLGDDGLGLADRTLTHLAQVVGWPVLERGLKRERFLRLRERYAKRAKKVGLPHPSTIFRKHWKREARQVLERFGLTR